MQPGSPPSPRIAAAALAGFAAFAFTLIVPTALRDGDTGWHLAAGAWIVEHARVPTTDPFSYTAAGRPWVAHEWLSAVAMYASYRAADWSALILLVGGAMAALFAIVAYELCRWMSARATIAALLLLATGLLPSLLARPHMLVLPILAGWLVALLHARERDRAPPMPLAMLMLIWANAHGSYVFGLALVGVFAIEALIDAAPSDRRKVVLGWGMFGLVALLAACATPAGPEGLVFPFYLNDLTALARINEWQPSDFTRFGGFEAIILSGLFFLLARPIAIPPVRLLLLLGVLHLTLQHARHEIILVIVGLLVLARPLGQAWTTDATPPVAAPIATGRHRSLAIVMALLVTGLSAYRIAVPVVRPDSAGIPVSAIRALAPDLKARRVFNDYGFGGPLIFAGIRPYIDGRVDMYGDAFALDYFAIADGDVARWQAADRRWRFGWTILPPSSRLVRYLDGRPEWRRTYADAFAVVHVRR